MRERPRLAGEQKVSKVNWRRTLVIGWQIALAGWRTRRRVFAQEVVSDQAAHAKTQSSKGPWNRLTCADAAPS